MKTEDTDGNIGNLQGVLANQDATAGAPITGATGVDGLMPGSPILPNILGLTTELDVFDQTPGGLFTTSGGTIAALGGVEGATASNHVLLGQFTTDGIFSFKLNLQIATPVQGESQIFVPESPSGTEILDTTLIYTSGEPIIDFVAERGKLNNQLSIYPNPCEDKLFVQRTVSNGEQSKLSIIDMTGRVVFTNAFWTPTQIVNTTDLSNGIYTIVMETAAHQVSKRFIKK